MKDFVATVERAMMDWWSANGERSGLTFRFAPVMEQRIFDARPSSYPVPKGSERMVRFLGMPVLVDEQIPRGEIHIADHSGKLLGKITGLDRV